MVGYGMREHAEVVYNLNKPADLPVLDLHEVADETVGGTTLHKVLLGCEELFAGLWTKLECTEQHYITL